MNSVVQTSIAVSRGQFRSNITLAKRSLCSLPSLIQKKYGVKTTAPVSTFFVQKRNITKDSWAAEGLAANGEILTSINHKENLLIDDAYMTGPPPAEIMRICDKILSLTIVDVHILVKHVTSRLGVTEEMLFNELNSRGGGGGGDVEAEEAVVAEPVKERDAFDIKLTVVDPKSKIKIIKEVRALTGLGLKEAKDLVEKAPVIIKQGVKKEEIDAIKKILIDAGATIEII